MASNCAHIKSRLTILLPLLGYRFRDVSRQQNAAAQDTTVVRVPLRPAMFSHSHYGIGSKIPGRVGSRGPRGSVRSMYFQPHISVHELTMAEMQKLQELIRRGTPRDLQVAQELMKTLAGAVSDQRDAPDHNADSIRLEPRYKAGLQIKDVT